ncbi:RNA polymerase sigma factor [Arcticibacter tournemirensis]|uniref:Sigma-70 family RNA polymerase sigma factor n=1 Tax=Arcticibacter tournemirensis TaxID=699437 RepID=A0A4Q0MGE5_9SPHI|nr:sigma-70 family RNA polymerase sigma factor [Arcticibacter tournemirensis]RXF72444.1 sigma-70 family RNA polymerase sigma factor [Arcticibacter tournemirensis]
MQGSKDNRLSDQQLWAGVRNADKQSYSNLVGRYTNLLFRYGIRFVNDEDFIKDCVQDVFFALWNCRNTINDTPSVKSYLFKALRLRVFRERTKWSNDVLDEDYDFESDFSIEDKLIEEQTSSEIHVKISAALSKLPRRQKEILYLRFYEEMDHDRIAQVMGLNKQSVYNLLHEAVLGMRKVWFGETVLVLLYFLHVVIK